jgi:hypothetical protein
MPGVADCGLVTQAIDRRCAEPDPSALGRFGAPVRRDRDRIGRPGTAGPMQASSGTAGYLTATYGSNRGPRQDPTLP